jgi:hypothetical protein
LYSRLKADGFAPWLDEKDLLPGQEWQEEIPAAVRASDVVIVCLSQRSVNKEGYLQREIRYALDTAEEKPEGTIFIIPARIEEVEVPKRLSKWQWANLFKDEGYRLLVTALTRRAQSMGIPQSYQESSHEEKAEVQDAATKTVAQTSQLDPSPSEDETSLLRQVHPRSPTIRGVERTDGIAATDLPASQRSRGSAALRYKNWLYAIPISALAVGVTIVTIRQQFIEIPKAMHSPTVISPAAPTPTLTLVPTLIPTPTPSSTPQSISDSVSQFESRLTAKEMFEKGKDYNHGRRGIQKDYKQAHDWYKKAADAGSRSAMNNLGLLYWNGFGVAKNYDQARLWFEKAAANDNFLAMYNLGVLYEAGGYGVSQNPQKARYWYQRAAKGNSLARNRLRELP